MKAIVMFRDLKKIIKSSKEFTSKDWSRPTFTKIMLYFNGMEKTMTAVAVDGFKMNVETIDCIDVDEDFTAQITDKIPFEDNEGEITITKQENEVFLESFSCRKMYLQDEGAPFDYKRVIPKHKEKFKIAFNPKYLIDVLKTCKSDRAVILEFDSSNNVHPMIIRVNKNNMKMLLPCRLQEEDEE